VGLKPQSKSHIFSSDISKSPEYTISHFLRKSFDFLERKCRNLSIRPAALAAAYRKICFKIHAAVFRAEVSLKNHLYQSLNDMKYGV
jgi:hypothetical protein